MKEKLVEQLTVKITDEASKKFEQLCKGRKRCDVLREAIDLYIEQKWKA
jgi:predicted DNA-binding protein